MPSKNIECTEGLQLLWELTAQPDNIVFHSPEAVLDNMRYLHGSYRWPAVYGFSGSVTVIVPKAGTFYPGFAVLDRWEPLTLYGLDKWDIPAGRPSFELLVDDKSIGGFELEHNDRKVRLFYASNPVEFKGGERLVIRTGPAGLHVIEDIFLFSLHPPMRHKEYLLDHCHADVVDRDKARMTWVSSWPSQCCVEWGQTQRLGNKLVEEEQLCNHRIFIDNLHSGGTYHYRITASKPDGTQVVKTGSFNQYLSRTIRGKAVQKELALKIDNPHDFAVLACPVTCGVPFAKGELGTPDRVRMIEPGGDEIPVQVRATGFWEDSSIKWVLASFLADIAARSTSCYNLEYGSKVRRKLFRSPLMAHSRNGRIIITTGPLAAEFDSRQGGFPVSIRIDGREVLKDAVKARVTDSNGTEYLSGCAAQELEIEERGPVRIVVRSRGHHASESGEPFFEYDTRFIFYADSPWFEMKYAWGNDRDDLFSRFKSVVLNVPLEGVAPINWRTGLGQGKLATGKGNMLLSQLRHDTFEMNSAPDNAALKRADGWIDASAGSTGLVLAVRDFWQLYPRSLAISDGSVQVGVSAEFPPGFYEHASDEDLVNLYFYLRDDSYKVRQGVKKWHEMIFQFYSKHPAANLAAERAHLFQEPLIGKCEPARYCETGVFGKSLVAGRNDTVRYDELCTESYENYTSRREQQGWYGQMNYGDLRGDSLVSWLNNEYDEAHSFLMQFARSGDRRWYTLGQKTAQHLRDIDICHYGPQAGAEWSHTLGHTGGYFSRDPYNLTRWDGYGSGNTWESIHIVCHAWVGGLYDWYCLSGDRTAIEALRLVADYSCTPYYINNYSWDATREAGWQLILLLTAYQATNDPYYLNAAHIIFDAVLEKQTPGPRGWHHQMVPSHCYCTPRHRGEASYMIGVLATALEIYYGITADARAAEAIVGACDQVIDEMWNPEMQCFRATSCPKSAWTTPEQMQQRAPLYISNVSQMLLFAYQRTGRELYLDIAKKAMAKTFSAEGMYPQHMYWIPRVLWYMDKINSANK